MILQVCYDMKTGARGDDQMFVPEGATCETPRLLYIHGGSWMSRPESGGPAKPGPLILRYCELGSGEIR